VGLLLALARGLPAEEAPPTYRIAADGNVSLAVYDAQGRMVRELARAEPRKAGTHPVVWDGLDRDGRLAPAGRYEWRMLRTGGLRAEYLMSVGTSVGPQVWPGNHDGPACVAAAEDSLVTAAATEGPPEIVRCTFDGRVLWARKSFEAARNPRSVAVGGGRVYYLQDNGKVHVLDLADGRSLGKPLSVLFPVRRLKPEGLREDSAEPQTATFDVPDGEYLLRFRHGDPARATTAVEVHPNGMQPPPGHRTLPDKMAWWRLPAGGPGAAKPIFLPQIYSNPRSVTVRDGKLRLEFLPLAERGQPVHWRVEEIEVLALPDRVAAAGDQLIVSCNGAGSVMRLDPKTGAVLETLPTAGVRDAAVEPDGTVLALTADSVVALGRSGKGPEVRIKGLAEPAALAVDPSGDVFVAEGGARMQIRRFGRDGRPTGTFGRAGGRRPGPYAATDFAGISGLAADGRGGFVVSERSAPRRVARFDREGRPVREWFGGMGFYCHTSLDPLDPTVGWMRPQEREWLIKVRMDYAARQWRPVACYRWEEVLDPAFFHRNPEYTHFRCLRRDLDGDGRPETLLWSQAVPGLLLVEDEAAGRLRPLAAMGTVDAELFDTRNPLPVDKLPAAWAGAIRRAGGDPADAKSRVKFARFSWADANGDGAMQAEELRLTAGPEKGPRCLRVDGDLTLWQGGAHTNTAGMFTRYRPAKFTACGAPVWEFASAETGPKTPGDAETASIARDETRGPGSDAAGDPGGVYALLRGGGDGTRAQGLYGDVETHGWAWPAVLSDAAALIRFDADGREVWRVGPKAARWPHPRGQLMSPRNINGFVRGCVAVGDQVEQPCEFWTRDGLYVGGLFDGRDGRDGRDLAAPGGRPDPVYTWVGIKAKRLGANDFSEHSLFAADDMLMGGSVGELPDGSVVFLGQGGNNNPCYRIAGWNGWERASGPIVVAKPARAAEGAGSGLTAEQFAGTDLGGAPTVRTDPQLWFSPAKGKPWPAGTPPTGFGVRWTGTLEPQFTEEYTLSIYARGEFRLWIDGREVAWTPQDYPGEKNFRKGHSVPIPLEAGRKVAIRLEFKATMPNPVLHLNWESLSRPVEHVPARFLYPAATGKP
jgi:hypothetical protein